MKIKNSLFLGLSLYFWIYFILDFIFFNSTWTGIACVVCAILFMKLSIKEEK